MHPHCAVKPNIKLGCMQGEGTGMWPCGGHLFSAVLSLPVCWGDFKRKLRAALMMGWFPLSTARAFISAGSLQGCPTTLVGDTGGTLHLPWPWVWTSLPVICRFWGHCLPLFLSLSNLHLLFPLLLFS